MRQRQRGIGKGGGREGGVMDEVRSPLDGHQTLQAGDDVTRTSDVTQAVADLSRPPTGQLTNGGRCNNDTESTTLQLQVYAHTVNEAGYLTAI